MIKKNIKSVLLLLSITLYISCGSVPIPAPKPIIKNVATNSNKNSNFIKANEWMVQSFNSAKSVIQFKDKEAGIVKGKYLMKAGVISESAYIKDTPSIYSIITIRVKDSVSRIEINAPSNMYSQKTMGAEYGFTQQSFINKANPLIDQFEIYMKKKSTNDNW